MRDPTETCLGQEGANEVPQLGRSARVRAAAVNYSAGIS